MQCHSLAYLLQSCWYPLLPSYHNKVSIPFALVYYNKVASSYDQFSLGVPASNSVLDHHSIKQDNKPTCCFAHTSCAKPVSVVRKTARGIGAPFPGSRRTLRTDGLSMLVSPCQCPFQAWWHQHLSKNILTKTLHFTYRQAKASGADSRPLINCVRVRTVSSSDLTKSF